MFLVGGDDYHENNLLPSETVCKIKQNNKNYQNFGQEKFKKYHTWGMNLQANGGKKITLFKKKLEEYCDMQDICRNFAAELKI